MRAAEARALAKKKRVKQKPVSSVTVTNPFHTVDRSHSFRPSSSFSSRGLLSPHSSNSNQTVQSISKTDPANCNVSAVEKQDIGKETVKPLTKAKEKLKVKSTFVVCSTESFLNSTVI